MVNRVYYIHINTEAALLAKDWVIILGDDKFKEMVDKSELVLAEHNVDEDGEYFTLKNHSDIDLSLEKEIEWNNLKLVK